MTKEEAVKILLELRKDTIEPLLAEDVNDPYAILNELAIEAPKINDALSVAIEFMEKG